MRVMSIIVCIAIVESFSLKYLPISEIKFVPLLMGMEVFVICFFVHFKFAKKSCHIGKLLYPFVLSGQGLSVERRTVQDGVRRCRRKKTRYVVRNMRENDYLCSA